MRVLSTLLAQIGWRRNGVLFVNGALGAFLFAPFDVWPLLFLVLPLFFLILDTAPGLRRAVLDGFWFGYGYFMAGTYWIAISMTVEAERFAWMIPFSVLGLSAGLALYLAVLGGIYHRLKSAGMLGNMLLFTALWSSMEWLRGVGVFGFPWNSIGYALVEIPALLQFASISGIYGLNILAVMGGLAVLPLVRKEARVAHFSIGVLVVVIVAYIYGIYHLRAESSVDSVLSRVRIVQANIEQTMKWDAAQQSEILHLYRTLSHTETDGKKPDIVVWPETALPFAVDARAEGFEWIQEMLPDGVSLVTGVIRAEGDRLTNALMALDTEGRAAFYDKRQLVPFGEFVPLRSVLPLERLVPGPRDFDRGAAKQSLVTVGNVPKLQAMVCYESIFPWAAEHEERARWLVTVTNDAWFGRSIGPYQHLAMGRVRAVEQGLPLVRAANTGISAVIDGHGIILKRLKLNTRGIIEVDLPPALPKTLYAKNGNTIGFLVLLIVYLLALRYRYAT
jgi:apolipoprotein N-acyltransferase